MDPVFVISNDARIDRAISVKDLLQYGKDIKSVKEITGWDQGSARVTCEEVKCKADDRSWLEKLFKKNNTNNNNNP